MIVVLVDEPEDAQPDGDHQNRRDQPDDQAVVVLLRRHALAGLPVPGGAGAIRLLSVARLPIARLSITGLLLVAGTRLPVAGLRVPRLLVSRPLSRLPVPLLRLLGLLWVALLGLLGIARLRLLRLLRVASLGLVRPRPLVIAHSFLLTQHGRWKRCSRQA